MVGAQADPKHIWIYKVKRRLFFLPRKSWLSAPKAILGFFPRSLESCFFWRLAFLRRFSPSEPTRTRLQPASRRYFYQRFLSASVAFEYVACLLGTFQNAQLWVRQVWNENNCDQLIGITAENTFPFSCEIRQCAFRKSSTNFIWEWRSIISFTLSLLLTEDVTDNAQVNRAQIY